MTAERISSSLHSGSYALLPKPTGLGVQESQSEASEAGVPAPPELECSVGVMAYNEQANIAHALDSILRQKLTAKRITEVIVVASGCEDQNTVHRCRNR